MAEALCDEFDDMFSACTAGDDPETWTPQARADVMEEVQQHMTLKYQEIIQETMD